MLGSHGGEANPATAHDHRAHSVIHAGPHIFIPRSLTIVMGVNVDEAGCHNAISGINNMGCLTQLLTYSGNLTVANTEVRAIRRCARAVND